MGRGLDLLPYFYPYPGGELGAARYPYPYFYPYPRWRVGAARESEGGGRACEGENDGG